jgi:hypothetical protein
VALASWPYRRDQPWVKRISVLKAVFHAFRFGSKWPLGFRMSGNLADRARCVIGCDMTNNPERLEDLTTYEREIVRAFLKAYPDYPVEQAIADMREEGL